MTIAHAACTFKYQCLPYGSTDVTFKTNSCGGSLFMDAFLHEFCRHFIEVNMLNALFLSETMSSIVALIMQEPSHIKGIACCSRVVFRPRRAPGQSNAYSSHIYGELGEVVHGTT